MIEPSDDISRNPRFLALLREHDLDPSAIYRVVINDKAMVVWQFHVVGGNKHLRFRCPSISYPKDERLALGESEQDVCSLAPLAVRLKDGKPSWIE